ncbi:predicted protein [Naegleria gruberi]|uniref:Predicted protein n=1 Tax=Naegleria gruberi TaxID=5762 RepID=D2W2E3_NAEGR|nr:uncharacterized protein NAEGRDRAFT_75558 [Naegleria gruberi]EFC36698.1 predicted protein [Naegleria gruberi]|eukprot:XP_002669442.1 predicted protein [Naegleria gruberi strain NEG-M]
MKYSTTTTKTITTQQLPKRRGRPCTRRIDPSIPLMTITRTEIISNSIEQQQSNNLEKLLPYENHTTIQPLKSKTLTNSNINKRKRSSSNSTITNNTSYNNIDCIHQPLEKKSKLIEDYIESNDATSPQLALLSKPNHQQRSSSDIKGVISPPNRKIIRTSISIKDLLN